MKPLKLLLVAIVAVGLIGCTQQQYDQTGVGTKTTIGALAGAAGGGLLASQLGGGATGIAAGVLLGGLLGGAVGNVLDQNDREYAAQTTQQSLESSTTGTTSSWQNPDSGNSGSVTPTRTYQNASGQPCREFTQTIVVGGRTEEAYGTACRQADGSWQIVQ